MWVHSSPSKQARDLRDRRRSFPVPWPRHRERLARSRHGNHAIATANPHRSGDRGGARLLPQPLGPGLSRAQVSARRRARGHAREPGARARGFGRRAAVPACPRQGNRGDAGARRGGAGRAGGGRRRHHRSSSSIRGRAAATSGSGSGRDRRVGSGPGGAHALWIHARRTSRGRDCRPAPLCPSPAGVDRARGQGSHRCLLGHHWSSPGAVAHRRRGTRRRPEGGSRTGSGHGHGVGGRCAIGPARGCRGLALGSPRRPWLGGFRDARGNRRPGAGDAVPRRGAGEHPRPGVPRWRGGLPSRGN